MTDIIQTILIRNRRIYKLYNDFRKQIFTELAPRESEEILYLLPWLLSVNHPLCPGHLPSLKRPFWVYGIDREKGVRARESVFKKRFRIRKKDTLLKYTSRDLIIHGIYTIGSIGTISQTSTSDCDIWICYDKNDFNQTDWKFLNQKIHLIKDWMDINLKIPVFFFITDISDIRNNIFGCVDAESSGTAQQNVLKEEFYRTSILICGKIPLWWLCWDKKEKIIYEEAVSVISRGIGGDYDLIDMGDLKRIDTDEYFGAALWQLHKSLTRPLKSLTKMFFLRMLLDSQGQMLICKQFRAQILASGYDYFTDPGVFMIHAIFQYNEDKRKNSELEFIKECFYLRCRIKPFEKHQNIKKQLTSELFTMYPLNLKKRIKLSQYNSWDFKSQIDLGNRLFRLLIKLYREMEGIYAGHKSRIDEKDLTILGRKIAACYSKKKNKIPVMHKPDSRLNLSAIKLQLGADGWVSYLDNEEHFELSSNMDLVHHIAFLIWNGLFVPGRLFMVPNESPITFQEILNLGKKIKQIFGSYDGVMNVFSDFLKNEYIKKILVIISLEKSPWEKDINDFRIVYQNSWGELFVRRFRSPHRLQSFMKKHDVKKKHIEVSYYLQRNSTYYEKIIDRTRNIIFSL